MEKNTFTELVGDCYPEELPYSEEECLEVFEAFFRAYAYYTGEEHPNLRREQLRQIMLNMPYIDKKDGSTLFIEPYYYPEMIEAYFRTKYKGSDYRINHFFSGRIRELKLYEAQREEYE